MEHVVFFPSPDGAPAFRRLPSLEEAVRLVEHLRNVEGVSQVSCHTLTEVPLAFRAYYRVEVEGEQPVQSDQGEPTYDAQAVPVLDVAPAMELHQGLGEPADQPEEGQPERHLAVAQAGSHESNGHAAGGAKSLGFFS